jgi:hypothetical protein
MLRRDNPPHDNQHQYSPSGWCQADMRGFHGGTLILYLLIAVTLILTNYKEEDKEEGCP